jgi:GH24 family phage-related lysozyme (muramidase)
VDPAEQLIGEEEGRRRLVYPDSRGFSTIAIGCLVDGRVKGAAGLCDAAIDAQFAHDSATARATASRFPGFADLNPVQQAALISMAFQLGAGPLGWHDFMAALTAKDYSAAKAAGLDSAWAKEETPRRANREMDMLATGVWVPFNPT